MGILLVNLGTPDSPHPKDVRRYLKEFLWDPRVVEVPRPFWWLVLNLIILNIRPRRSAKAYARIWTGQGSPLAVISTRQRAALQAALSRSVPVALGMRYGRPSIAEALAELRRAAVHRILVLPLYPQYSATTTASIFDAVSAELRHWRHLPELRFVNRYHLQRAYVEALANSVREHWERHGQGDCLVMSFHGIPQAYAAAGDPYPDECAATAGRLAHVLGLADRAWRLTFQSRMGRQQWLRPYTDRSLAALPGQGVKRVQVICPGFAADCLETLDEIALENREVFLQAGGEDYEYIPCLNDRPDHIHALADLVKQHTQGWNED